MKAGYRTWLLCLICGLTWLAPAAAQYPNRPIRFVVPFPPGGGTDTMARAIGTRLGEALGQQIVIDNRGGGGANIGAALAAASQPDGHTWFLMTGTHTVNATLYRKLGYDLVKDFVPVTHLGGTAYVVVVHPSIPAKSVKELVALAKAQPGELRHSSSGIGSGPHLAGELFKNMTGVHMLHVPYKGGGPSVLALVGGEAKVGFTTTPSCITQLKAGRLRGLAVSTAQRSPFLPDLPTVAEAGVPGYETSAWYGLVMPTGTSKEIVSQVNAKTAKVLTLSDVRARLDATGMVPQTSSPEELNAKIHAEVAKWAKVVKALGLKVD
ncbi:MAG: tripartite tricarboxylate transporter substrate binding protein [Betaproteobacteria bacterium]|nr:tripartite tricarboxylate transporter substrate binding protein [Betaproteobacteria bacterium]